MVSVATEALVDFGEQAVPVLLEVVTPENRRGKATTA